MSEPLRPLSTGELLDRTFTLYRKNFLLFVGIAALAPACYVAMQLAVMGVAAVPGAHANATAVNATALVILFLGVIAYLFGLAISHAATVQAVSSVHLGRPTSVSESYGRLKGMYLRVVGVFLSVAIRVFGGSFLLIMLAVALGAGSIAGGAALGIAGGIIGGLIALAATIAAAMLAVTLFVRYAVAVQACVVENLRGRAALKRSVVLTKGSRSRVLTVYTLFAILAWIVSAVITLPALAAGTVVRSPIITNIASLVATFVAGALVGPLATIGMSVLYFDERVRKEAFDLQLMMASLEGAPAAAAAGQSGQA